MEQIKPILQAIVTYRFWVVCGIIIPLMLTGWFMTTSTLSKETSDGKSRIDSAYSTGSSIRGVTPHPNDLSAQEMDRYIAELNRDVYNAWKFQYDNQKDILVWPTELEDDFIDQVKDLVPIEATPKDKEIRREFRERYRDYIQNELPKLAKIINATWLPTAGGGGGGDEGGFGGMSGYPGMAGMMPGGGGMGGFGEGGAGPQVGGSTKRTITTVNWDAGDQGRYRAKFDWSMLPEKVPRTLDILYSQEDLWVLRALMDIIASTNAGATARYNATVKDIRYIQMGRDVGPTTSRVARISAGGAMGGMAGYPGMGGESDSGMMAPSVGGLSAPGMGMGMGGAGGFGGSAMAGMAGMPGMGGEDDGGFGMGMPGMAGAMSMDPAEGRYVDNAYQQIKADRLRTALDPNSTTNSPEDAFLVVAKRIPIRLGLLVDQRKLNGFIAACGNSKLMVEVRQVRVNRIGQANSGGFGGGMGGMPGMPGMGGMGGMGGMPGMPGMSGFGGGGDSGMGFGGDEDEGGFGGFGGGGEDGGFSGYPGMGMPGQSGGTRFSDTTPFDLPVEIYGMVYIYNPVDTKRLGIEQVTVDTAAAGATGTAPNADEPATTPAAPAADAPAATDAAGTSTKTPAVSGAAGA